MCVLVFFVSFFWQNVDSDLWEERVEMRKSGMVKLESGGSWKTVGKESKMILAVVEFVVAERKAETDFKIFEIYRGMVSFCMGGSLEEGDSEFWSWVC